MQISLFNDESKDSVIDKQLATLNIDQKVVEQLLVKSKEELKRVNSMIKKRIKDNNH